ncbi:MAG: dodecin [Gammaproteobacteria bacterium]
MLEHVYKSVELTGSSSAGIEDALNIALERAKSAIHNIRWFEVSDIRGVVYEDSIAHW